MRPDKALKKIYLELLTLARFGTRWPGTIALEEPGLRLHFDPRDRRARKKLIYDTARRRPARNRRLWRLAATRMRPTLALDVGLNYGECLFSARYPEARRIVGIEANRALAPYIERSREDHPDGARIEVVHAIAGASGGGEQTFYTHRNWSGASTAVAGIADRQAGDFERRVLPVIAVDDLLLPLDDTASLLFKIDVEGYEPTVFAGMGGTLAAVERAVGFLEIDSDFLAAAGHDGDRFLDDLNRLGEVHAFRGQHELVRARRLGDLARTPGARIHTDLVFLRGYDAVAAREWLDAFSGWAG